MRRFLLIKEDESTVAEGIIFSNGRAVICWVDQPVSVVVYATFNDLIIQQEKSGKQRVQWMDAPVERQAHRAMPPSLEDAAALLGGIPPQINDRIMEDNAWKLQQRGVDPKTFEADKR
jgi:hypothetical protein